ncbi:nucleic acid-binding protein [Marinobacter vinifirmus]|uniref:Nucleic acid-binding protein n=1 Tax=Marinobacter vinifirmus TaxID=355591 RepID=A0A7Z1DVQ3_9GAMM|nr:nucleotide-binding protein [Marinobacter vinifirmus]OZC35705.1 nucleic acid-binding protein [Marinobacter vinifirmus]
MASRKKSTPPEARKPLLLEVTHAEAESKLEDRIVKGTELKSRLASSHQTYEEVKNEFRIWNDYNEELLKRLFTSDEIADEYSAWVGVAFMSLGGGPSRSEEIRDLHDDIDKKVQRLNSIKERLELIPESTGVAAPTPSRTNPAAAITKKVFVVHGHDEVAKTNLEIFLREIGLDPIVLHRQADEGLTIIEKFEKHSDVGYAFILLTPDEVAYGANEDGKPDQERTKELRARPNVVFEFGYFVGKLGRSRTCCLYTGDVTLPSDISGMIYKKYSASIEEVAYGIIKDLRAVGYELTVV